MRRFAYPAKFEVCETRNAQCKSRLRWIQREGGPPRFQNSVLLCVLKPTGLLFAMTSATHREESKFNWPWRSILAWKDGLVVKVADWGCGHVRRSLACVHAIVFYCVHPWCAACVRVCLCVCVSFSFVDLSLRPSLSLSLSLTLSLSLSLSLSLPVSFIASLSLSVCRVHVGATSFTKAHPCCCWHVTCGTA